MRVKKTVCFFSVLLLFSTLMCSVDASSNITASFSGGGVTIDLTYPEEAHPNTTITHNVTITAHVDLALEAFALFIYAPVNTVWQEVKNRTFSSWDFYENETLTTRIEFDLPQQTNGTLYCVMTVKTDQTTDTLSYKFYTTQVREMTYSELLEDYNVLNNTYNQLVTDYDTLNNTYNDLLLSYETLNSSYNDLLADYNVLNNTYNQLVTDYDTLNNTYNNLQSSYAALNASYNELSDNYNLLNSSYNDLLLVYNTLENDFNDLNSENDDLKSDHNSLIIDYNELQSDYGTLNSTYYNLTETRDSLEDNYNMLNQTYTDLLKERNDLEKEVSDSEIYLNNDKIIMFIFTVAVAALVVFIIYLKRKKQEPYVVIRKETVSVNKDEDS